MKRVVVAVILLIAVTGMSAAALWTQNQITHELLAACDELIAVYESGDIAHCRADADKLYASLEEKMWSFPFFLRHERMEDIFQQAATLPHLINDNDPADFLSAVSSMRMQLEILMDNEWPTPENIL